VGRLVSSLLVLGSGVAIGVVVGTLWPTPGVIKDWLTGPVERVVLGGPSAERAEEPPAARLEVFRDLQTGRRSRSRPSPSPAPAREPRREVAALPPASAHSEEGSAARVIADLAEQNRAVLPQVGSPPPTRQETDADDRVVQVASYVERAAADALGRRLQSLGFDAYVTDGISGGEVWYRVRVRPAFGEGPAELSSTLRNHGYKVWVTDE
jgi:cell division protein FtsN